ncbi:[NiFe]-hydrogenase assembly, chaperone, HybE [Methylovulum psychrotolerans]|uniref:[NiFe]-hydrogenase assembly, chaperone, HybE n=2 Tax=Methylovulum psychrotolerans TaxID=1704499 RepID=A0A2S5CKK4_9GAMM|nr:[NiFe]-hydrogenase assembly, chaperone, HybE [Methylovulum psychrotolerans]
MRRGKTRFFIGRRLMRWQDGKQLGCALETVFNNILATRMQEMPVLNNALSVQAIGFRAVETDWLGIVVTPWFMNLLLVPGQHGTWQGLVPGGKIERHFPYGLFEFTVASEAAIGLYAACSLFSPMFLFDSQAAAVISAQTALQGLLAVPAPHGISRRNILRGSMRSNSPE